jgi:Peptidase family M23
LEDVIKINKSSFEKTIIVPTQSLQDGNHTICVEVVNGIYNPLKTHKKIDFIVDNHMLQAALVKNVPEFNIYQGKTIHVRFQVNKPIKQAVAEVFNEQYPCFPETPRALLYECFVPISCDEKVESHLLRIHIEDLVGNTVILENTVTVLQYAFKNQQLKVNEERVAQEKALGLSDDQLEQEILALARNSPQKKLWQGNFYLPTQVKAISTEFGAIRVTKEKGRYMHKAVDILNTPKSVVWAPQSGIVAIKERYALTGNTIVIDHGYGILSLLCHLDEFGENIKVGSIVQQGNPVGTLGKTGFATGYHLHWAMYVKDKAVDPLQWVEQYF